MIKCMCNKITHEEPILLMCKNEIDIYLCVNRLDFYFILIDAAETKTELNINFCPICGRELKNVK